MLPRVPEDTISISILFVFFWRCVFFFSFWCFLSLSIFLIVQERYLVDEENILTMAVVRVATCAFLFLFTACVVVVSSFVPHAPLTYSRFQGTPLVSKKPSSGSRRSTSSSSSSTSLRMFLGPGNDGGILGIGAPEVVRTYAPHLCLVCLARVIYLYIYVCVSRI